MHWLMMFREFVAAHSENYTENINRDCGQNEEFLFLMVM
jgi:hypothetical protein